MDCPAALLEGVLTADDGDLVVVGERGVATPVDWAATGHLVRGADGVLAVVDRFGLIAAREGDFLRLGGGENRANEWIICGQFDVESPSARVQNLDAIAILDDVRPAL